MNCDDYRIKHSEYSTFPIPKDIWESDDYQDWQEHDIECEACSEFSMGQKVIKRGHKPESFPCVHVAYHSTMTCVDHDSPWECPDMNIVKVENDFGIPVRDGGQSYLQIYNCPWCGIKL